MENEVTFVERGDQRRYDGRGLPGRLPAVELGRQAGVGEAGRANYQE